MTYKIAPPLKEPPALLVLGGGGHGRTVVEAAQLSGRFSQVVVVDANACKEWTFAACRCVGDEAEIPAPPDKWQFAAAVGESALRKRLFDEYCGKGYAPASVFHPAANISRSARMGRGCVILASSVVGVESTLADGVIVNNGAVVEHDCNIGEFVHLAPGAVIAGGATLGAQSFMGSNSSIRHGISVSAGVTIGNGAVVASSITVSGIYVGNPAKRLTIR